MNKILSCSTALFSLVIYSICFNTLHAQDIPRWEDYKPDLDANNVNDVVVNSQGEVWLLSNSHFFNLEEKQQFKKIEEAEELQADHIEIDSDDNIWLVSENNFQFNGNHLAYGIYVSGLLKSLSIVVPSSFTF